MKNVTLENGKGFTLHNIEIFEKGEMKGYLMANIEMNNNSDREHELLYRVNDPANGESNKLVSIDYGYNNSLIDELWDVIENTCYNLTN